METVNITFKKLVELCEKEQRMASGCSHLGNGEPQGQNYIEINEIRYQSSIVAFDEYMNQSKVINKKLRGE